MKILRFHAVVFFAFIGLIHATLLAQSAPDAVFPKRSVALAFLGSRLKLQTEIAPLLQKYNLRATFFIDDAPQSPTDDLGTGLRHMTWPEIAALSGSAELGNFTARPETETGEWIFGSRPEQIRQLEIVEQRFAGAKIPKPSSLFYPNGMADPAIFQFLADRGYTVGLVKLPAGDIDFYKPSIDHPLLIPCLTDPALYYKALDEARAPAFPQDRILVFGFDCTQAALASGDINGRLKLLAQEKFKVLSIGDLAACAGDAMSAMRYWDMRYATYDSRIKFSLDSVTNHWWIKKIVSVVSGTAAPPQRPAWGTLASQLQPLVMPKVDFDKAPLQSCLDALTHPPGSAAPVSFFVDPEVDVSTPVTLHLANVPYFEALRYLSRLAGVRFSVETYAIAVNTSAKRAGNIGDITPGSDMEIAGLENARISQLDFTDATLDSVIVLLAHKLAVATGASSQPPFVLDPSLDLSRQITLHVSNMPFNEALRYVGQLANAQFIFGQYAIYVQTAPPGPGAPTPPPYVAPTPFALVR